MAGVPEHGAPHYGNLLSYKYYMRPTAQRMYGSSWRTEAKHHKNIQRLLEILALNGTCTTWDMAKLDLPDEGVRGREKEIRRLLTGRTDRGKHSSGALELGLITVDGGGSGSDNLPNRYKLSLHGILYCLDTLMLNENDMDRIASRYASALPRLFGRWDQLKEGVGGDVYRIRILARGLLLDNPEIAAGAGAGGNPIYELMSYVHIKYRKRFEFITEEDLADQISLWFYTCMLYDPDGAGGGGGDGDAAAPAAAPGPAAPASRAVDRLRGILRADDELNEWYMAFVLEADGYYARRSSTIRGSGLLQ